MAFGRILFSAILLLAWPPSSRAQSSVSGRYLIEPLVGRYFSRDGDAVTVFGARGTWRRSYARSLYAAVIYGRRSRSESVGPPHDPQIFSSSQRNAMVSIGLGSTILDRDATGSVGAHFLLGVGFVSFLFETQSTYVRPDGIPERHEFDLHKIGPVAELAMIGELELFSPKVLLRTQAGAGLALRMNKEEYEGVLWFPGASVTLGLAIAF